MSKEHEEKKSFLVVAFLLYLSFCLQTLLFSLQKNAHATFDSAQAEFFRLAA